jgi:hypothetical protein
VLSARKARAVQLNCSSGLDIPPSDARLSARLSAEQPPRRALCRRHGLHASSRYSRSWRGILNPGSARGVVRALLTVPVRPKPAPTWVWHPGVSIDSTTFDGGCRLTSWSHAWSRVVAALPLPVWGTDDRDAQHRDGARHGIRHFGGWSGSGPADFDAARVLRFKALLG